MGETKQLNIGGRGVEFQHFANRVIQGMLIGAPTTGSAQATGAAGALDGNVNISAGLLAVGSTVKEYVAQADFAVINANGPIQVGESIIVDIIAYKSVGNNTVYLKAIAGAAAVTASVLPPTDASIEAYFETGTPWMRIGRTQLNRTADTTVTQTYDNTVRNTMVPGTVHYGVNPLP